MILEQEDLTLVLQQSSYITNKIKVEVLDNNKQIIDTLEGIVSGTVSINGESDVRRTCSLTVQPTLRDPIRLSKDSLLWLNKDIRVFVGLYNTRTKEYKYYPMGYYMYTNTSGTYNATTNQLSISCSDFVAKLDGTKNGQVGALVTKVPAYEENPDTGEVIKYNIIRDVVIQILTQLGGIKDYRVDDIGEYKGLPDYNENYEQYRINNPLWNTVPYDQEFSAGCSVFSILSTFRDLYPNYEMFFDENNNFIYQLKPMCYEDNIYLDNDFIQRVLISENTSVDMSTVRNVCEVWGQTFETDYYNEEVTYSNNVYSCTIQGYGDSYGNGEVISLKIPQDNQASCQININGLGNVVVCDEDSDLPINEGLLKAGNVYSFRVKNRRENKQDILKMYLLGQWQVHAINVLTDGTKSADTITGTDGKEYIKYSKSYFKYLYNCNSVEFNIVPNSPFTVQKLGVILDVKTGNEYDNITSDSLALVRAEYENWKNCRLTDNITITTSLLPFMDVNKKITYKPSDSDDVRQYIVNSVSHDFSGNTTTIQMYRFYPLYQNIDPTKIGTHEVLSQYTHEQLSVYTHEQLTKIVKEDF